MPGRRRADVTSPGREELARIALQLFAERHFSSVSIRDIGRAANVNSAMIYYHFKDKRDLLRTAIETATDDAFALFESRCNTTIHHDAADVINRWLDVHVALSGELRKLFKITLDCKGLVEPIKQYYRQESQILRNIIRKGMARGAFKKVDPAIVATMISTTLDGIMARSFFDEHFDMAGTVREFKMALGKHLGYQASKRGMLRGERRKTNGRKAGDRSEFIPYIEISE